MFQSGHDHAGVNNRFRSTMYILVHTKYRCHRLVKLWANAAQPICQCTFSFCCHARGQAFLGLLLELIRPASVINIINQYSSFGAYQFCGKKVLSGMLGARIVSQIHPSINGFLTDVILRTQI